MNKYRDWELFDQLPDGWQIDRTVGTPLHGYSFCNNKISILNGGRRALVKVCNSNSKEKLNGSTVRENRTVVAKNETTESDNNNNRHFPGKTINNLARKKAQEKLLKDIAVDLLICEIEGWDKTEYLNELIKLINSLKPKQNKLYNNNLPSLFYPA